MWENVEILAKTVNNIIIKFGFSVPEKPIKIIQQKIFLEADKHLHTRNTLATDDETIPCNSTTVMKNNQIWKSFSMKDGVDLTHTRRVPLNT